MKKLLILVFMMFWGVACADTINLHWLNDDGTTYQNSSCTVDGDLIVPTTPPTKYGYTFTGWEISPYTPIEYLESTGTQYMNLGFTTREFMTFKIKFSNLNGWIIGTVKSAGNPADFGISKSSVRFGSQYVNNLDLSNAIYTVTVNSSGYSINGQQINLWSTSPILSETTSICLFWANGSSLPKGGRVYYLKIWQNNTLFRDFIPVLDKYGNPCMYDIVEGKFYYNAGTGDFIAGPVLSE